MKQSLSKTQPKLAIQRLGLSIALAISLMSVSTRAMDVNSVLRKCVTAFSSFKKPSAAEVVFERALAEWDALKSEGKAPQIDDPTLIVRAAVNELAIRNNWDQEKKVRFFREITNLIRDRAQMYFVSDEFRGSDGSVLFQGGTQGVALVIGPTGEIYRGNVRPTLDIRIKPTPVWNADYSNFRVIEPKLN